MDNNQNNGSFNSDPDTNLNQEELQNSDSNANQNYNSYYDNQQSTEPVNYQANTGYSSTPIEEPKGSNGMAIASLVLGILSILTVCCVCPTFIFSGLGIIFGILSKGGAPQRDSKATFGIVISAIALVVVVLLIVIYSIYIANNGGWDTFMDSYENGYYDYDYSYDDTLWIRPLLGL